MESEPKYQIADPAIQNCLGSGSSGVRKKVSCGGFSFSGIWSSSVFGVRCLWRHSLTLYSCFQAKFVDIIGIFFYPNSPYFCKKSSPIHSPDNKVFENIKLKGFFNPTPLCTPLSGSTSLVLKGGFVAFHKPARLLQRSFRRSKASECTPPVRWVSGDTRLELGLEIIYCSGTCPRQTWFVSRQTWFVSRQT